MTGRASPPAPLQFGSFSSRHVGVRDLDSARAFYVDVLCGTLIEQTETLVVRFVDFDIVAGVQPTSGMPIWGEYPHGAFTVSPDQFLAVKERLDDYGVPTNHPWTRKGKPYALMYFRDPFGSQYELFAPKGCPALDLRVGARAGGDYVTDFEALAYSNLSEPKGKASKFPTISFNHLTVPVRNLNEGKAFLVSVLGGVINHLAPGHVTCTIGGVDYGIAPQKEGWTAQDALYPHYCFNLGDGNLEAISRRLGEFEIPCQIVENDRDASVFFRDPSGNLMRISHARNASARAASPFGRAPRVDLRALAYNEWRAPE